jgi:hypothetical protein
VHWWKLKVTKFSTSSISPKNVVAAGRSIKEGELEAVTFTTYGIVYSMMIEHDERLLKSKQKTLNYFTHYSMVLDGMLWRGSSWGGTMTPDGMRLRSHEFSRRVARRASDEAKDLPVSPSTEMKRTLHRTQQTLSGLVELCLMWINTTFPRIGMVWSSPDDYPAVLREAIALLKEAGGDAGEC